MLLRLASYCAKNGLKTYVNLAIVTVKTRAVLISFQRHKIHQIEPEKKDMYTAHA